MMKKAQGLSMNLIVIVVLALIVLAILVFVVGKYTMKFRTGADAAESSICMSSINQYCTETECKGDKLVAKPGIKQDCTSKEYCCKRV